MKFQYFLKLPEFQKRFLRRIRLLFFKKIKKKIENIMMDIPRPEEGNIIKDEINLLRLEKTKKRENWYYN